MARKYSTMWAHAWGDDEVRRWAGDSEDGAVGAWGCAEDGDGDGDEDGDGCADDECSSCSGTATHRRLCATFVSRQYGVLLSPGIDGSPQGGMGTIRAEALWISVFISLLMVHGIPTVRFIAQHAAPQ
ncbi:hypothetical protein BDZ91DRAFT_786638 [Kalaharituber pfeilii]|nr:hypothetical protein BDZ91DRAFT_786638 [Kalaharituber pfeilii]